MHIQQDHFVTVLHIFMYESINLVCTVLELFITILLSCIFQHFYNGIVVANNVGVKKINCYREINAKVTHT